MNLSRLASFAVDAFPLVVGGIDENTLPKLATKIAFQFPIPAWVSAGGRSDLNAFGVNACSAALAIVAGIDGFAAAIKEDVQVKRVQPAMATMLLLEAAKKVLLRFAFENFEPEVVEASRERVTRENEVDRLRRSEKQLKEALEDCQNQLTRQAEEISNLHGIINS